MLLGVSAISFAGIGIPNNSTNIGSEAGVAIVASEQAKTAAANFNYNTSQLAQIGTEAGTDVIASDKAKIAAANFDYNTNHLAWVGTEAGQNPIGVRIPSGIHSFGAPLEQVVDKESLTKDGICNMC